MSVENRTHTVTSVKVIGELLRRSRKAQGMTQQEFADIAGVGVRFISDLERGKETAEIGLVLQVLQDAGFDILLQQRHQSNRPYRADK